MSHSPTLASDPLIFTGAGLTHVGRVRPVNEDSILTDPSGVLWAVADGMGGYGHGDVASSIVVERLSAMPDHGDPRTMLASLLTSANREVRRQAEMFGGGMMGATVVAVFLDRAIAHIAWAGDSRAYLCRRGHIRLLTRDHTVVQELVEDGLLMPHETQGHEAAHVVTRAVGAEDRLEIDHMTVPIVGGDRFVLCSDGLTNCLDDGSISDLVHHAEDPDNACKQLVTRALEAGAPDNVSVIVVFVEER